MKELISKCLQLPKGERERLISLLHDSLKQKKDVGARYNDLLRIATSVLGSGIDTKCRDTSCVIGRMLITYKMRAEGYTLMQIGNMLGRHHASILHLERMMEDVFRYPECFKIELAYWNMFIKELKEHGIH